MITSKQRQHSITARDHKHDAMDIMLQADTDGYQTRVITRQRGDGEGVVRHHTRRRRRRMRDDIGSVE